MSGEESMNAIVRGDEAPGYDRVVVMAVAVEEYQNAPKRPAIKPVDFAVADAEAFIATIEEVFDGIVDVDAHPLIGSHASLTTIDEQARYVIDRLSPTDLFVFYYAGHGCQIGGANRLTAWDTNPLQLANTTVDLNAEMIERIRGSECSRALLFVDACAETMRDLSDTRSMIFDLDDAEIEKELEGGDYIGVFLSCSDGERSHGSAALGHGIFTWHLLKALRGEDPRALAAGRWLTDVSLRDWLKLEMRSFITTSTTFKGTQTPRAILNATNTFRIRHVPVPATTATKLTDLRLENVEAYLESVETGAIRSLSGFDSRSNNVPKKHADSVNRWVERLLADDLKDELNAVFELAKEKLGFGRKEGSVEWADGEGGGNVDTPAFRYAILCDQDPDDPACWRVRRQLELRDGWDARREEVADAIVGIDLDRFVVSFDTRGASYDGVADALEDLSARGGRFSENKFERTMSYSRDDLTIEFDFARGTVDLSVAGKEGLELAEAARSISLGWTNSSPMLASAPPVAALPAPAERAEAEPAPKRKLRMVGRPEGKR